MRKHAQFALVAVSVCAAVSAFGEILLADPTIFRDENRWIIAGTEHGLTDAGNPYEGIGRFPALVSTDLRHWQLAQTPCGEGRLLTLPEAVGTWGFWAPQIFKWQGRYYLVYTVDYHWAIAVSDSPLGPYVRHAEFKGKHDIDAFLFGDDDGRVWAYYSDSVTHSTAVVELSTDLKRVLQGPIACVRNELPWERKPLEAQYEALNKARGKREYMWGIGSTEGPCVLKRHGKYVLFHCANDFRSPDYCVGVAVADKPIGPWRKLQDAAVLSRAQTGFNGTGHGDAFVGDDGHVWYLFHAHNSNLHVSPRRTGVIQLEETIGSDGYPRYRALEKTMRLL